MPQNKGNDVKTKTSKSIVFLAVGLIIGAFSSDKGLVDVQAFFVTNFKGVLALFLLEMGITAAKEFRAFKEHGLFLVMFGILMPLASATVGAGLGVLMELSIGGTTILAILAASSSYIAVPAAMRVSVPKANSSLSIGTSLGVTFPFNILVGIPVYYKLVQIFYFS